MNEAETRAELIDPALREAGWGVVEHSRIRREQISPGRLIGGGRRGKPEIADYVLHYRGHKLAVIEAKKRSLPVTEGVGQAKLYADKLDIRFAYSTNGDGIYQVDMETGEEKQIDRYPTPDELWQTTFPEDNEWRNRFGVVPFETQGDTWETRYYQHNAVTSTLEAISENETRILLSLATGTGKTFIAFQLAWKLFKSRWNVNHDTNRLPRILFLADRNILADQAFNAFSAFPQNAVVRIDPEVIRKRGAVPKNGSVFFTIFQTFMTGVDKEGNPAPNFGDYPPDFFDFIIIDECHRGGANDESTWRSILEYFSSAVQLGLTATPKRQENADTYNYFGKPKYEYSLQDGINDGFLTPFRVKQISTTIDDYTYTSDDEIEAGEIAVGDYFEEKDFNTKIAIHAREKYRVDLLLEMINQSQKTLVFCANQPHALFIRDLINQGKASKDPLYCVRVTADDGERGEQDLRYFQDNERTIPTVLTTSKKLSTGVDARNVRNIVLLRPVKSMIEFKQIIGRGTRLFEGKDYFTIYDFVKAYEHFNDPEWDGPPAEPPEKIERGPRKEKPPEDNDEPDEPETEADWDDEPVERLIRVTLSDGKKRNLQNMVRTTFWNADGRPISSQQFLEQMLGDLPELFQNEDQLRELWSRPDTRKKLLSDLEDKGYGEPRLNELAELIEAKESDLYDVLLHIAYASSPLTRAERASNLTDAVLDSYGDPQREFIKFVIANYVKAGFHELDSDRLKKQLTLKYGGTQEGLSALGGALLVREVFDDFQKYLYQPKRSA